MSCYATNQTAGVVAAGTAATMTRRLTFRNPSFFESLPDEIFGTHNGMAYIVVAQII
jgi:hypothetical protein